MTEPQKPPQQQAPTQIGVGAQYVKDLSFESPNAPQVFSIPNTQPEINIGVNVSSRNLADHAYEVLLALKLEAKLAGKIAYIVDLAYAGVFVLPAMAEDQAKLFLMVEAPRLLFPFARAVVADAVRDGGFAPMMLNPVDFMALYQANKDHVGLMPTQGAA